MKRDSYINHSLVLRALYEDLFFRNNLHVGFDEDNQIYISGPYLPETIQEIPILKRLVGDKKYVQEKLTYLTAEDLEF